MTAPANAAVRERRRRSTPLDVERMNVMKALTAAEHSRRQFILNFAASRDTQLLIPGQKSDAVKAAEEWVALRLAQNGYQAVSNEYFKYSVDARLWSVHVGSDLEFPFAFMRAKEENLSIDSSEGDYKRPTSEDLLGNHEVDFHRGEILPVPPAESVTKSPNFWPPRKQQSTPSAPQTCRQRHTEDPESVEAPDKKRSMSLHSLDDLKTPKPAQDKLPFFVRLGRSWSRRRSAGI